MRIFRILLLGLPAVSLLLWACGKKKNTVRPEETSIVESVYASATLRAADQYSLYAPFPGVLQELTLQEGDSVSPGQLIALIENTNPSLNAENARLGLELSRKNMGNLEELEAQLATARRQATLDSVNYARQKELWQKEVGTRLQVEKAQLSAEASANNYRALLTRYRQLKVQLSTSLEQARNQYEMAAKTSGDYRLSSHISGRVYALNYRIGELVGTQKPVAVIGRAGQFMIDMDVDEVDISRLRQGQTVLLSMDAYQGQVFEARVTRILPSLDVRTQTFRVEAEFVKAPPTLYPGLSAEANIVISKKEKALVIPLNYLKTPESVMTSDGEVKVKTGLKSLDKVEILSGIDANTELIKP